MYMSNYWYGIVFKQSAPKSHGPSFLYIGRVRSLPYFQIYHIPTYISHIYSIQTLYGVPCCALLPILSISPHPPRSTKGVLSCHPLVHPWKGISKHPNGAQIDAGRFPSGSRSLMSTTAKAGELHSHRDFYLIGILKNPQFNPLDIAMIYHKTMQWGRSFACQLLLWEGKRGRFVSNLAGRPMDGSLAHSEAATTWQWLSVFDG